MKTLSAPEDPLLIAVAGPTASGKSALAVEAALRLDGEIINCDSLQLYRELQIGTGKPSARETGSVPHHLYDFLNPDQFYSAGRYMVEARRVCRQVRDRGRVPFVVGGTGLYLRALLAGVFEGPSRCEAVRDRLEKMVQRRGRERLHRLLSRKDPATARKIGAGDRRRLIRALEVYFLTGTPISRLQERRKPLAGYRILKIGLNLPRPPSLSEDRFPRPGNVSGRACWTKWIDYCGRGTMSAAKPSRRWVTGTPCRPFGVS